MSAKRKMGLVTPSSWIREKGREIICPEGAQIVVSIINLLVPYRFMPYRITIQGDLAGISKIQSGWRVKIAKSKRNSWSWKEGDDIVQIADDNNEILVVLRKDRFDELVKNGVIQIV